MLRAVLSLAALLAGLGALGACNDEGDLTGSLTEVYRLEHESVRARLYSSELSIEYARDNGSVPIRLTLRRKGIELAKGMVYDLAEQGAITGQLEDGTEVPKLLEGSLELEEFEPSPDSTCRGNFEATFEGARDTLGLSGHFDTELNLVDWPTRPALDGGAEAQQ